VKQPRIECDFCDCWYHADCTEMSAEAFDVLVEIANETGWVCRGCRSTTRMTLKAIQASQAKLVEEIASLAASNVSLLNRVAQLEELVKRPKVLPSAVTEQLKADVAKAVRDDAQEKERRRNNIIVTGIPPEHGVPDDELFLDFCVTHLKVKPLLVTDKCKRIDRIVIGRVPRLRVVFANVEARDSVLKLGKTLKNATDQKVRTVYLNPDLTPVEAKEAFEARVERRAKRMAQSSDTTNIVVSGSATSADLSPFQ